MRPSLAKSLPKKVCEPVTVNQCRWVVKNHEKEVDNMVCRDISRQECRDVPRLLTRKVPQEVTKEQCKLVPVQECRKIPVQVAEKCRLVTKEVPQYAQNAQNMIFNISSQCF